MEQHRSLRQTFLYTRHICERRGKLIQFVMSLILYKSEKCKSRYMACSFNTRHRNSTALAIYTSSPFGITRQNDDDVVLSLLFMCRSERSAEECMKKYLFCTLSSALLCSGWRRGKCCVCERRKNINIKVHISPFHMESTTTKASEQYAASFRRKLLNEFLHKNFMLALPVRCECTAVYRCVSDWKWCIAFVVSPD